MLLVWILQKPVSGSERLMGRLMGLLPVEQVSSS